MAKSRAVLHGALQDIRPWKGTGISQGMESGFLASQGSQGERTQGQTPDIFQGIAPQTTCKIAELMTPRAETDHGRSQSQPSYEA